MTATPATTSMAINPPLIPPSPSDLSADWVVVAPVAPVSPVAPVALVAPVIAFPVALWVEIFTVGAGS